MRYPALESIAIIQSIKRAKNNTVQSHTSFEGQKSNIDRVPFKLVLKKTLKITNKHKDSLKESSEENKKHNVV